MKTRFLKPLRPFCVATLLAAALPLAAQEWQVIDTFEDGVPQGTWTLDSNAEVDTSSGYLTIRPKAGVNNTSAIAVDLPQSYSSGKFTLAFDFYAPTGAPQNQVGWGVGSPVQKALGSWGKIGSRNRFQLVSIVDDPVNPGKKLPQPQNAAKVPNWSSDIFGTTEQGVVYNVWLVYDLDADPKTVTSYTKKATDLMAEENLVVLSFDYDGTSNDDWSEVTFFGIGQGLQDHAAPDTEAWDSLGGIFDNIYVSSGENITLTETSFQGDWLLVDTFAGGAPEAEWTVDNEINLSFENEALLVTATLANAGASVPLPITIKGGSTTLAMDVLFPSGGLNSALFAAVGEAQLALTGAARFGNNDRFLTFGSASPQALTKWTAWAEDFLGDTQQDQWYHLWLVYDHDAMTVEVYSALKLESGEAVLPLEPSGSFDLLTDYASFSHFIVGGWQANNAGIRLDNIYQSFGKNISIPGGDEPPPPFELIPGGYVYDSLLGWTYGLSSQIGQSLMLNYVYVGNYPSAIYSYKLGWLLGPSGSAQAGLYYYRYDIGNWIWVREDYGGFYWDYASSSYGSFFQ